MAGAKFVVTAPAISVTVSGRLRQVFQGEAYPEGVDAEHTAALVDLGFLHKVGDDKVVALNARGVGGTGTQGLADIEAQKAAAKAAAEGETVEVPEGDPSEEWTGKQLDAYAAEHNVDVKSATTKADKVAAINAAKAAQ